MVDGVNLGALLMALFLASYLVAAVFAAGHALLYARDPRAAWGWIAVCWLAPLAGVILYALLGTSRTRRRARRVLGKPEEVEWELHGPAPKPGEFPGVMDQDIEELIRIGTAVSGRPLLAGHSVRPLFNGEDTYPAMVAAIARAQQRVWMSSYIFQAGRAADALIAALAEAHARGVAVHLLIDRVGSLYDFMRGVRALRRCGIDVRLFELSRSFRALPNLNLRNHRKLLIIDQSIAFIGGLNVRDYHYLHNPESPTQDLHFEVQGPVVEQMADVFARDRHNSGGKALPVPAMAPPPIAGGIWSRIITEGPDEELDRIELVLTGALANAHERVCIMTPYFVPTPELARALETAALRGVHVDIMLPETSNLPWVHWAARRWLPQLVKRGVRVWLRPPPFAHSKLFIVDGYYVLVGSANLDPRSLRLNFEVTMEAYSQPLVARLRAHFDEVMAVSRPLLADDLRRQSLPARLRNALSWLFSAYL